MYYLPDWQIYVYKLNLGMQKYSVHFTTQKHNIHNINLSYVSISTIFTPTIFTITHKHRSLRSRIQSNYQNALEDGEIL